MKFSVEKSNGMKFSVEIAKSNQKMKSVVQTANENWNSNFNKSFAGKLKWIEIFC